ncbi:hypothetical protein GBO14_13630 [Pseudoalteromonas shioyasakiensis]|uniref:hypothetical protein n=1 Tax=Pseudoalteromonas shioyasakiensis TaxID=1190813 RepID=UPI0020958255|nr:hypothetical protein [Pseudoalteromonas shioyasakiensis]MCO6355757.1 hypothetical protein [Pseudoalteromonas shioyasakiensis]
MASNQNQFLDKFKNEFEAHFGSNITWKGGQSKNNVAAFKQPFDSCRNKPINSNERFELGDLSVILNGYLIVIEFESKELPLSNLLKYWPYLRGEFTCTPERPILLCHFSDWWSYATRRDLWQWTIEQMCQDSSLLVELQGKQFNHGKKGGRDVQESIQEAIDWISSFCKLAL